MTRAIKAHFDGMFIVPDEPVDLPVNKPLRLVVSSSDGGTDNHRDVKERLDRLARVTGSISSPVPTGESLRREHLYGEAP